jgi:hypothetical protein
MPFYTQLGRLLRQKQLDIHCFRSPSHSSPLSNGRLNFVDDLDLDTSIRQIGAHVQCVQSLLEQERVTDQRLQIEYTAA